MSLNEKESWIVFENNGIKHKIYYKKDVDLALKEVRVGSFEAVDLLDNIGCINDVGLEDFICIRKDKWKEVL